jgi:hypothetical protein
MIAIKKPGVLLLALLPLSVSFTCCKSAQQAAGSKHSNTIAWQASPVQVDGIYDDWTLPLSFADDKALIQYAFSNDQDNLYIILKTGDRTTKMKILGSGMVVWLDTEAKKNKTIGIGYPLKGTLPAREFTEQAQQNDVNRHAPGEAQQQMVLRANQLSLQGFPECSGSFKVTSGNPCGIQVKVGMNDLDELVWEAAIPLKALSNASLDALKKNGLSICFDIKAFSRPTGTRPNDNEGGGGNGMHGGGGGMHGGGGGMGGGMRGGMGGGMNGGGGHMRPDSRQGAGGQSGNREATTTWAKIRLSSAPGH